MVRFTVGRGPRAIRFVRADTGRVHHEQRRFVKARLGLIR